MGRTAVSALILAAALLLAACGVTYDGGNVKVVDDGRDVVSVGRDGFKLDGNVTGVTLDGSGLNITYPNGSIVWDNGGFNVKHADGTIRIADGKLVVTDKDGRADTLDTTGKGAEYVTEGGAAVRTGEKAAIPDGFPLDKAPLMDGFELNASAELGGVKVVSGFVPEKAVGDALAFYQPLLMEGESYSQDKKDGCVVLRAKLGGAGITIYLVDSLTADAVNISIVTGN
jgi:hypothetical protein